MKTLLLGSDFVYDKNDKLVPIEINTNTAMDLIFPEPRASVFELTGLREFVLNNTFNKITYIGGLYLLDEQLSVLCIELNLEYDFVAIHGSTVIPYIEDTPEHLIIRSAYDINAIVDTEYCANKIGFMNLIKSELFRSQFAYLDETNTLVNNITTIPDNGNHPNFILKAINPHYNKTIYPKLFKVSNQDELNTILQNVTNGYFLMEYHYNQTKLYDGLHVVIRSFNLLTPPTLKNITIGNYKKLSNKRIDNDTIFNSTTFEIDIKDKSKYFTNESTRNAPKILSSDLIQMWDDSFKTGDNLLVGDMVKTIVIPNPNNIDLTNDISSFGIEYDTFVNETIYTSNEILGKNPIDRLVEFVRIIFDDGTFWGDAKTSSYLILRNNNVRFIKLDETDLENGIREGDQIILIDHSQPTFTPILKNVIAIVTHVEIFSGYEIAVDVNHTFLSKDGEEKTSYVSIEHNVSCTGDCVSCGCHRSCTKSENCFKSLCDINCTT